MFVNSVYICVKVQYFNIVTKNRNTDSKNRNKSKAKPHLNTCQNMLMDTIRLLDMHACIRFCQYVRICMYVHMQLYLECVNGSVCSFCITKLYITNIYNLMD